MKFQIRDDVLDVRNEHRLQFLASETIATRVETTKFNAATRFASNPDAIDYWRERVLDARMSHYLDYKNYGILLSEYPSPTESQQPSQPSQSKLESLIEAAMNVIVGFVVAISSQLLIFPVVGIDIPFSTNLTIGVWFTAISITRSYIIRRWFNGKLHAAAHKLANHK